MEDLGVSEEYSKESAEKLVAALEEKKRALTANVRVSDDYKETLDELDTSLDKTRQETERNAEA